MSSSEVFTTGSLSFRPAFSTYLNASKTSSVSRQSELWFPEIRMWLIHWGELHPFRHPRFYVNGHSGSSAGLPSHSGRSADGGARSSPSTQRFAALVEATQADRCGSISLGPFVAVLTGWRSALLIVKPETVIAWHRKGFRVFWTWKAKEDETGKSIR